MNHLHGNDLLVTFKRNNVSLSCAGQFSSVFIIRLQPDILATTYTFNFLLFYLIHPIRFIKKHDVRPRLV